MKKMFSINSCIRSLQFSTLALRAYKTPTYTSIFKRAFAMQAIISDKPEHSVVPFIANICGVSVEFKKEETAVWRSLAQVPLRVTPSFCYRLPL